MAIDSGVVLERYDRFFLIILCVIAASLILVVAAPSGQHEAD